MAREHITDQDLKTNLYGHLVDFSQLFRTYSRITLEGDFFFPVITIIHRSSSIQAQLLQGQVAKSLTLNTFFFFF